MTSAEALTLLRESRDAEHDAPIWTDNGVTLEQHAWRAGVRVEYVHVDLSKWRTERRTVDGKGAADVL
jgi:hypothetical protein